MPTARQLAVILFTVTVATAQPQASRLVMVLPPQGFAPAEYAPVRRLLEASGVRVTVAGLTTAPCQPAGGGAAVTPEVAIGDLRHDQFEGVLVVGGTGQAMTDLTTETAFNRATRALVGASAALGKLVAATGNAPALLAQAGLLRGRQVACQAGVASFVTTGGGTLADQATVIEPGLITARDAGSPAALTQALVNALPKPAADTTPPAAAQRRALLVIANQDFYYREYGDTRRSLEEAGVAVTVAAPRRDVCRPHGGSGEGADGGLVRADLAITDARMADYDALVYIGGWGAVCFEPTYTGVFDNQAYNVPAAVRQASGRLIDECVRSGKLLTAICHGVSVLAWARVDGRSPIAGKTVSAYAQGSPGSTYQGQHYADNQASVRMQVEQLAGATMVPSRSVGNPATADDDVVVDGRVITAENYDSAREFGRVIARELAR